MKPCADCGTPLTTDEITYLECWCNDCEGRRMMLFNEEFNENERVRLVVDSQFDGVTETIIVQVR